MTKEKIESFEISEQVKAGLQMETSYGVVKAETDVTLNISVGYKADEDYGWFEMYDEKTGGDNWYAEGGLWFDGNELTDYDGVFSLSQFVVAMLEEKGFNVSDFKED